ncbi:MAG: hypothetical protein JSS79_12600 [Bacteroidetes bacterium]|nr:hypothetical protein [Bacteroidota bacterium]
MHAIEKFIRALLAFSLLLFSILSSAQSRMFVTAGISTSLGGNLSTFTAKVPAVASLDVEWDRKVMGSLYAVYGVSTYGVGYSTTHDLFAPSDSEYSARFISVPLMARWNVSNRNFLYIDFGINTSYLAQAHLHESFQKFSNVGLQDYDGNIGPYLNRFYQTLKFQETFAVNRFIFSIYMIAQVKGQNTINNLSDHWGLNVQQSTFLNSNGYSDYFLLGFKLGCRIR